MKKWLILGALVFGVFAWGDIYQNTDAGRAADAKAKALALMVDCRSDYAGRDDVDEICRAKVAAALSAEERERIEK